MHTNRLSTARPEYHAVVQPAALDRRASRRCLTAMQVLPESFQVVGDLSATGASYSTWTAPTDDLVSLRVELFGVMHRLPARVVRVHREHNATTVHVAFEALPANTRRTLDLWVAERMAAK